MPKYYFTYGTDTQYPYRGGWTEIEAPDMETAKKLFQVCHPNKQICLNCAKVYTEKEFAQTKMTGKGNFGAFCQERIYFSRQTAISVTAEEQDSNASHTLKERS